VADVLVFISSTSASLIPTSAQIAFLFKLIVIKIILSMPVNFLGRGYGCIKTVIMYSILRYKWLSAKRPGSRAMV